MKKVMFALCFMFGGIVVLNAQDTTSNQYRTETQSQYPQEGQAQQGDDQQQRERIQTTELPDEVKRALEGQEYRGWLISGAFKAQAGQQSSQMNQDNTNTDANRQESPNAADAADEEVYIVELKNGAETKTVAFDKNGEQVEGMDNMQNNQNSQFNQNDENQQPNPNNQYDQNEQPDQSPESGQTDPRSTSEPADPSQSESETETRTDQSAETQSPDQSSETQSSQSSETDQSRANEPK